MREALEAIRARIDRVLPMRQQREFLALTSAHCEPVEKLLNELRALADEVLKRDGAAWAAVDEGRAAALKKEA